MIEDDQDIGQLMERISDKKPDLVEFRLDRLNDFAKLEAIAQKKTFPAIATDKSKRKTDITRKLLLAAASAGFELIDIELSSPATKTVIHEAKSHGAEVIVSFHDLSRTPNARGLTKVMGLERKAGGDVFKIVTTAIRLSDNLTVLDFLADKSTENRLVSFAMGSLGTPSRILSPIFGAEFTFAALDEGSRTAEGQLTIDDFRSVWQILGIQ